jgi:3-oxoacyl-[acyl-carrier-protein] synthase-3
MKRPGVVIRGTGHCVPSRVMTNDDFAASLETSDEWIRTRTGIRERRRAGPDDTAATLGAEAARKAIHTAGLTAADIDLIVVATVTPDFHCPATANLIQAAVGCRPIPAFDVAAACTGFLYAMHVAEQFLRGGTARHVLVVGTDVLSRLIDDTDRNTCILFGDGAGAVVLGRDDDREGLLAVRLFSDGAGASLIQLPGAIPTDPSLTAVRMNGREVFRFAVTRLGEMIVQGRADAAAHGVEIDHLIPHQVNQRIIDAALAATEFPADKVTINLERYGNTSAASIPIALDEARNVELIVPGETVLLAAFGGGLTWGSVLLRV